MYESEVITKSLYESLLAAIPEKYSGQPPVDMNIDAAPAGHAPPPSTPAPPANVEYAELIYDFEPQQASDLKLRRGDKIQVSEKLSPDWWKGKVGSQEGVFPSNYVRLLSGSSQPQHQPHHEQIQQVAHHKQEQPPFPPPSTEYYQQLPPQEQQQQQQPQQPQHQHRHLKKFGKQLKDAAIFGAGATIGSDIVNSIF